MLETLSNLKNNTKRNATQNQGGDAVDRMKKFLTVLGKKKHGKFNQSSFSLNTESLLAISLGSRTTACYTRGSSLC